MKRFVCPRGPWPIGEKLEGIIVAWYLSEGLPIDPALPLLTLKYGARMLDIAGPGSLQADLVVRKILVKEGERIAPGNTLALVGHTGEMLPEEDQIDSLPLLKSKMPSPLRQSLEWRQSLWGFILLFLLSHATAVLVSSVAPSAPSTWLQQIVQFAWVPLGLIVLLWGLALLFVWPS